MSFDAQSGNVSDLDAHVQIYTFAGHVIGAGECDGSGAQTGLARALSHDQVIDQMAQWGFRVTAISALQEVHATLGVLEAIAIGSEDVHASEYVNLLDRQPPYREDQVFALSGRHPDSPAVFAGFAVAGEATTLVEELVNLKFEVTNALSLADLRAVVSEMLAAQAGAEEGLIDLIGSPSGG